MKKVICLILALAVMLAVGCTNNSVDPTESPSQQAPGSTQDPTEEEKDVDLLNITSDTDLGVIFQEDLSFYGVAMSDISIESNDYTDTDEGIVITLGNSENWCQGLQFVKGKAGDSFANAKERKYIRFWVGNPGSTKLGVMFIVYDGSKEIRFDSTKAILTRCDGQNMEVETDNPSGAGENTSVMLPAGFSGWVSFRTDEVLTDNSSDTNFELNEADGFKLDVRPITPINADYYVIDDFVFTDSVSGTVREYKNELPADSEEAYMQLRYELDSKINGYLDVVPSVKYWPSYDPTVAKNIKAITYDGAMMGENKTKVFAYIGYPEGAKEGDKYPAVVLIHGGGGHAFYEWVAEWNKRGYVAIAMDNTGFFPKKVNASLDSNDWVYGLRKGSEFYEDGYASVMQTDHFATSGKEVEKQWMYHAVVQAILAHNLLKADPMVDSEKIGITGISWGSVVTSLTIGYDKYAFAVPQYCAGYLNESLTYKGDYSKNYPAYDYLWQAEDRWDNVDFPVLWLQYTKDGSATPNTNSKCYLHTKDAGAEFTLIMNWAHGHDWTKEEVYRFADCAINGKQSFAKAVNEPTGNDVNFEITVPDGANVTARICYMTKPFARQESDDANIWYIADATVNGTTVTGTVPADADHYYIEFTTTVSGTDYNYNSATSIVYLK